MIAASQILQIILKLFQNYISGNTSMREPVVLLQFPFGSFVIIDYYALLLTRFRPYVQPPTVSPNQLIFNKPGSS